MNWHIGKRIGDEVLKNKRAEYGKEIVASLSQQLTGEYGKGFSRPNLFKMVQFAELFPDTEIVSSLTRQLTWTHFSETLPIKDQLKRDFYAEMCRPYSHAGYGHTTRDLESGSLSEKSIQVCGAHARTIAPREAERNVVSITNYPNERVKHADLLRPQELRVLHAWGLGRSATTFRSASRGAIASSRAPHA